MQKEKKNTQLESIGGCRTPEGKIILPETAGRTLGTELHQDAHLGSTEISALLRPGMLYLDCTAWFKMPELCSSKSIQRALTHVWWSERKWPPNGVALLGGVAL